MLISKVIEVEDSIRAETKFKKTKIRSTFTLGKANGLKEPSDINSPATTVES